MPIAVLLIAILFGVFAFGLALCAIEENPFYWFLVLLVAYACVVYFLKFLAMC